MSNILKNGVLDNPTLEKVKALFANKTLIGKEVSRLNYTHDTL